MNKIFKNKKKQERLPFIPESILKQKESHTEMEIEPKKTERDLELEQGRDYFIDLRSWF